MVIKVTFRNDGDGGEYLGCTTVGYWPTVEAAKASLVGLCPWDFNPMGASGDYRDFMFEKIPGLTLTGEPSKLLVEARKHAQKWKNSWHRRALEGW